ncbi:MAG: sigma-70 family RNA polymerase sigma factor, partial [Planctomycetota bacterium]
MSHDAPLDPELLLEHGPFIRALARQLLNDHLRAEDAVQETWLTGLRRPPEDRHALRAWLARVVRNRAIQMRRADRRRDRREASVARSPDVPSPEEILEREALRRRIVEAVMTLEEPYRSTVLLRFFDELPPRLIAKRLSLPVETVKTRLWRATEMLRSRLHDDRPSSHRRAGLAALAGLDRPRDGMLAGWLTSFGTLILGTAMSIKMKLTSAGSLALVIALLIWTPWSGAPATPTEIDRSPVADLEPPSLAVGEESAAPVPTISREGEIVEPASAEPSADELSSEPETRIEGRFVDAMGSPVPGVEVTFRTERSPFDPLESASSDEAGRFSASVQVEEKEAYLPDAAVRARAPGYVSQTLHTRLAAGQTKDLGDIVLESAGFVSGRVLDPVDAGIAGARVFATRPIRSSGPMHVQMARARGPSGDLLSKGVTLGDGSYRLDTAPPGMLMIWAVAEGKLHSFSEPIELTAGEEIPGIDLVLHPVEDTAITGIVLDRSGSPAQRARIRYEGGGSGMMSTDREGRFRIRRDLSLPIDIQAKEKNGDWQSAVLEEVPAGSKDITLVLDQEIPKLRLEVMDTAGNAVEQFLAFARDPSRPRLFRALPSRRSRRRAFGTALVATGLGQRRGTARRHSLRYPSPRAGAS